MHSLQGHLPGGGSPINSIRTSYNGHSGRATLGSGGGRPDHQLPAAAQRRRPGQNKAGRRSDKKANLYLGGPVTGPLMAVHCDPALGEIEILPGLFFSGGEENVHAIMRRKGQPCRVFTGYTGWGPGQWSMKSTRVSGHGRGDRRAGLLAQRGPVVRTPRRSRGDDVPGEAPPQYIPSDPMLN